MIPSLPNQSFCSRPQQTDSDGKAINNQRLCGTADTWFTKFGKGEVWDDGDGRQNNNIVSFTKNDTLSKDPAKIALQCLKSGGGGCKKN